MTIKMQMHQKYHWSNLNEPNPMQPTDAMDPPRSTLGSRDRR